MSVYLDRFLNVPATRLPKPQADARPGALLAELRDLLDRQQQVDEAGAARRVLPRRGRRPGAR